MASGPLEKPAGKRKSLNIGHAVMGCFVRSRNNAGPVYAVVCQHVTKTAKGPFFLDASCLETEIARKINLACSETECFENDVDLIKFVDSKRLLIQPIYRNISGEKRKFRLYDGQVEGLYRTEVFQCIRPTGKCGDIPKLGKVLETPDLHQHLRDLICLESNFIVDDVNGEAFANEGDSGRIVAREADNGYIELVGIVTWGQFQCRDDPKMSGNYSVCLLLRYAIEYLNQQYQLKLCLYDKQANWHDGNDAIEPGQVVAFTTNQ